MVEDGELQGEGEMRSRGAKLWLQGLCRVIYF